MELQRSMCFPTKGFQVQNLSHLLELRGECGDRFRYVMFNVTLVKAGTSSDLIQNLPDHDRKMAVKYGNVFGTFEGIKPTLRINDTRLIQSIFIKDFDHFINRRVKLKFQLVLFNVNHRWQLIGKCYPEISRTWIQSLSLHADNTGKPTLERRSFGHISRFYRWKNQTSKFTTLKKKSSHLHFKFV